ncbi:MAG TPA: hypothetical protein VH253_08780 [Phycisphaerae bacterium]|nr:hypothetical protein [Phycisphaerae bacterium]
MPDGPRPSTDTLRAGHELSGVAHRGIGIFVLWFFATAIALHVFLWFFLAYEVHREARSEPGPFALGADRPTTIPQPLQPSIAHNSLPWQDLPALRDSQLQQLNSAGPIPADPAHVHIPIDHAIQLFLQNGGLSTKPNPAATAPAPPPAQTQPWIIPNSARPKTVENRT